jgi:hypothetical protein
VLPTYRRVRKGRKGAQIFFFKIALLPLLFPYEWIPKNGVFTDFDSEMIKILLNFDKTRDYFYKGAEFFSSAAEYFGQSGRIILERVGNFVPVQ